MMTGRNALSSKLPSAPAIATAVSSPITWMATISIASAWVGLTLPGMIEEPGSLDGRISSCRPVRGPEPSQRMSLANLNSDTARARSAAETRTSASQRGLGGELVGRGDEGMPGELGDPRGDLVAEPRRRVQPGADRRAADRQPVQPGEGRARGGRRRRASWAT